MYNAKNRNNFALLMLEILSSWEIWLILVPNSINLVFLFLFCYLDYVFFRQ